MRPTPAQLEAARAELDALAQDDAGDVAARLAKLTNAIAVWHADKPGVLLVGRAAAQAALRHLLEHANTTASQLEDMLRRHG